MGRLLKRAADDKTVPLESLLADAKRLFPDEPEYLLMEQLGVARDSDGFGLEL